MYFSSSSERAVLARVGGVGASVVRRLTPAHADQQVAGGCEIGAFAAGPPVCGNKTTLKRYPVPLGSLLAGYSMPCLRHSCNNFSTNSCFPSGSKIWSLEGRYLPWRPFNPSFALRAISLFLSILVTSWLERQGFEFLVPICLVIMLSFTVWQQVFIPQLCPTGIKIHAQSTVEVSSVAWVEIIKFHVFCSRSWNGSALRACRTWPRCR